MDEAVEVVIENGVLNVWTKESKAIAKMMRSNLFINLNYIINKAITSSSIVPLSSPTITDSTINYPSSAATPFTCPSAAAICRYYQSSWTVLLALAIVSTIIGWGLLVLLKTSAAFPTKSSTSCRHRLAWDRLYIGWSFSFLLVSFGSAPIFGLTLPVVRLLLSVVHLPLPVVRLSSAGIH